MLWQGHCICRRTATIAHMTIRVSGLLLILLALRSGSGRADEVIPIPRASRCRARLALWTLSYFAARRVPAMRWVVLAVAWGSGSDLGETQQNPGDG